MKEKNWFQFPEKCLKMLSFNFPFSLEKRLLEFDKSLNTFFHILQVEIFFPLAQGSCKKEFPPLIRNIHLSSSLNFTRKPREMNTGGWNSIFCFMSFAALEKNEYFFINLKQKGERRKLWNCNRFPCPYHFFSCLSHLEKGESGQVVENAMNPRRTYDYDYKKMKNAHLICHQQHFKFKFPFIFSIDTSNLLQQTFLVVTLCFEGKL